MICEHVKQNKISFKEFVRLKNDKENIYFYCKQCKKIFIARRQLSFDNAIILYIFLAYSMTLFINLHWFVEYSIFIILGVILELLKLIYEWKHISYEEIDLQNSPEDNKTEIS